MSLLIVGSVAFDAIETPFGKTDRILGGAGTYISLAASYFGIQPKLISVVGNDFGNENLELLQKYNIDIEGVQIKKDEKTFFWSGKYYSDMNTRQTLVTELNSLEKFDPQIPDSYQNVEFLMLGNLSPVVQRQVIERLRVRPKFIAMDTMNFWMNIMLDELLKTISMVDMLIINDEEARQLSGEYSLLKAARKILNFGLKYLIIKKGEHGALLFSENQMFSAPGLPLEEVFDPTGAGDTFAGGLIGYLARENQITFENLKNGVIAGSAMASFNVQKFGVEQLLDLNQKMIYERLQQFVQLAHFNYQSM
jgi:sugar/nucleoside kinase (ribokinase family)